MRLAKVAVSGSGVMALAAGYIFGLLSLIGFFLPWFGFDWLSCGCCYMENTSLSGWDRFPMSLYPWLVFAGSIMMIVFAACAVIVVVSNGSKSAKITLAWIAAIGSIMVFSASLMAMGKEDSQVAIMYGLKLCAVFSFMGLIGFGTALIRIIKPKQNRPETISPSP